MSMQNIIPAAGEENRKSAENNDEQGTTREIVPTAFQIAKSTLEAKLQKAKAGTGYDYGAGNETVLYSIMIKWLVDMMNACTKMNDREKDILARRMISDTRETLEEVAVSYQITRERIRQIENRSENKLRYRRRCAHPAECQVFESLNQSLAELPEEDFALGLRDCYAKNRKLTTFFLEYFLGAEETEELQKFIREISRNPKKSQVSPETEETKIKDNPVSQKLLCPQCGAELVVRTARRGRYIGAKFLGCSNYPRCYYISNLPEETDRSTGNNH